MTFKAYVQHLMAENSKEIYEAVFQKNGHFYVCGEVQMAADVTQTLELILQTLNCMTVEQSKECVLQLKEDQRFHDYTYKRCR